ncbi:MAG: hypothetical protein HY910_00565 [Desulfarculus sp.]|nr:hypothetical protein [Desulfarculus sp.]
MAEQKTREVATSLQSQLCNIIWFLACWALLVMVLATLRLLGVTVPFPTYKIAYVLLASLTLGLVVILGVLPSTRFGPPESLPPDVQTREERTRAPQENGQKTIQEAWQTIGDGLQRLRDREAQGTASATSQLVLNLRPNIRRHSQTRPGR